MNGKIRKHKEKDFNEPALSIDKVADADTVIGKSIITVSGTEVIPLSSGNGTVITVKPKGFLIDDGKGCRLLKMEEGAIDTLIDKTGELVHRISDNA